MSDSNRNGKAILLSRGVKEVGGYQERSVLTNY